MRSLMSQFLAADGQGRRIRRRGGGQSGMAMDIDSMPYEMLMERFPAPDRGVDADILESLPVRSFSGPTTSNNTSNSTSNNSNNTGGEAHASAPPAENDSCSICMEEYVAGDNVKTLPCLHCFHGRCVDTWLAAHRTCPVCKYSLS